MTPLRRHSAYTLAMGRAPRSRLLIILPNLVCGSSRTAGPRWRTRSTTMRRRPPTSLPLSFLSDQLALIGPLAIHSGLRAGTGSSPAEGARWEVAVLVPFRHLPVRRQGLLHRAGAPTPAGCRGVRPRGMDEDSAATLVLSQHSRRRSGCSRWCCSPSRSPLLQGGGDGTGRACHRSATTSRTRWAGRSSWAQGGGGITTGVPETLRSDVVILTSNYGEAGAIDTFGPSLGLPRRGERRAHLLLLEAGADERPRARGWDGR